MAWYHEDDLGCLNFIIVGNDYAGHSLLQASLAAHPEMACHGKLFDSKEATRKQQHEDYFGCSGKVPDWYQPHTISIEQYLNNKIFDNALNSEKAIGVCLNYSLFVAGDIWEYVDQKCRCGDFCLLHVTRNPVACFIEYLAKSGEASLIKGESLRNQVSFMLDPVKLTEFTREHLANELKINRLCHDRAIVPYHELVLDKLNALHKIFGFLEVPFSPACVANTKKLSMCDTRSRIANLDQLSEELPLDIQEHLFSSNLF